MITTEIDDNKQKLKWNFSRYLPITIIAKQKFGIILRIATFCTCFTFHTLPWISFHLSNHIRSKFETGWMCATTAILRESNKWIRIRFKMTKNSLIYLASNHLFWKSCRFILMFVASTEITLNTCCNT